MRQTLDLCMINAAAGGIDAAALDHWAGRAEVAMAALREKAASDALPLLALPAKTDDLAEIKALADWLGGADHAVMLGTGGSSLGGQALAQIGGWHIPGLAPVGSGNAAGGTILTFVDNLDPASLETMLAQLPLAKTRFLIVSKSGGTGETLLQAMAVLSALEAAGLGARIGDHIRGLSEVGNSNKLRRLLAPYDVAFLDHDPRIGGRYAALSNVGLVPAVLQGLDPIAIRAGAAKALAPILAGEPVSASPAAMGAAVNVAMAMAGKSMSVFWAYADRLERFTRWYVQLWSESLGKNGKGTTPLAAIGPVDQHSQLQLFLDGPNDKFMTLIMLDRRGEGPRLSAALAGRAGEDGFADRTIGDFVWAQQCATADTLARNGRPVRRILLDRLDASAIGELMMHFMLETIITADLLEVNAFDQPAVEEGKVLAKRYLAEPPRQQA